MLLILIQEFKQTVKQLHKQDYKTLMSLLVIDYDFQNIKLLA